jgi:hypothetical protein
MSTAPPSPPRTCTGTLANGHNLFGKGVVPYREIKCSIADCCAACAANASCGAWFAKESPKESRTFVNSRPDRDGIKTALSSVDVVVGAANADVHATPLGECKLFSFAAAEQLTSGGCPKTPTGVQPVCASRVWTAPGPAPRPVVVNLSVASRPSWTVSPWLATMSLVYCWAPDAAGYKNGTMARWANTHRFNTARFPAGTASYWNW